MAGYTKLFSSILGSSIWSEDASTRIVWITLLAMADQHGEAMASHGGLARLARVSREDCDRAIKVLESPDPDSRTPDNDGRRIEPIPGGWDILNYEIYRAMGSKEHKREMDALRQSRKRIRDGHAKSEEMSRQAEAEAEAEAEEIKDPSQGSKN
jgi:hypothetical protein